MAKEDECWRDIEGYEGIYQVSSLGRVKSLKRIVVGKDGRKMPVPERILRPALNKQGYLAVILSKNSKLKAISVHQLVAIAFLGHTPAGMANVVDHINHDRLDNRVENLDVITQRENTNLKHIPHSSKYTGVLWNSQRNKWQAGIVFNKQGIYLGLFEEEIEANNAYQKALAEINAGTYVPPSVRVPSSKYRGVSWVKRDKKWTAYEFVDGKQIHLGVFESEEDAHQAVINYQKQTA